MAADSSTGAVVSRLQERTGDSQSLSNSIESKVASKELGAPSASNVRTEQAASSQAAPPLTKVEPAPQAIKNLPKVSEPPVSKAPVLEKSEYKAASKASSRADNRLSKAEDRVDPILAPGATLAIHRQTLRSKSIADAKVALIQLVREAGGTISLGQPKGSPLTASIQIPASKVDAFAEGVERLRTTLLARSSDEESVRGSAGALGYNAAPPTRMTKSSEDSQKVRGQAGRDPKSDKKPVRITIELLPISE
jgi:hypothetical protein